MSCLHCNKSNFDSCTGCFNPKVFSPAIGDWICSYNPVDYSTHISVCLFDGGPIPFDKVCDEFNPNGCWCLSTVSGDNSQ